MPYKDYDRQKANAAAWNKAHPERRKEITTKWKEAHPDKPRETIKAWRKANPEKAARQAKASHVKRAYGLTLEEYEAIMSKGCAITGSTERLHLDHCHATGKVRGALCGKINTAIGLFNEDPRLLRAAAEYLEAHHFS